MLGKDSFDRLYLMLDTYTNNFTEIQSFYLKMPVYYGSNKE